MISSPCSELLQDVNAGPSVSPYQIAGILSGHLVRRRTYMEIMEDGNSPTFLAQNSRDATYAPYLLQTGPCLLPVYDYNAHFQKLCNRWSYATLTRRIISSYTGYKLRILAYLGQ